MKPAATKLVALARALATLREAEDNGNPPRNARHLMMYLEWQGYTVKRIK